jgi:hypothetical protein
MRTGTGWRRPARLELAAVEFEAFGERVARERGDH